MNLLMLHTRQFSLNSNQPRASIPAKSPAVLVDAHVHAQDVFDVEQFFDSAYANFHEARRVLAAHAVGANILLLAESSQGDFFRRIRQKAMSTGRWKAVETNENISLAVTRKSLAKLLLVAGRQIVTREGLEVLAIGTLKVFPDGLAIGESLLDIRESGALAIIPWGFGKWSLRRGRILDALLEQADLGWLALGDNGCRPTVSLPPRLFAKARQRGMRILPGSDPLPFPREVYRVASYGFALQGDIDVQSPWASLGCKLCDTKLYLHGFGRRTGLAYFLRNQILMQLRKRSCKPVPASAVPLSH